MTPLYASPPDRAGVKVKLLEAAELRSLSARLQVLLERRPHEMGMEYVASLYDLDKDLQRIAIDASAAALPDGEADALREALRQAGDWKGASYAADTRKLMSEALSRADKVLGGDEGQTILGYTLPAGLWLMLQANVRNLLDTLPPDAALTSKEKTNAG